MRCIWIMKDDSAMRWRLFVLCWTEEWKDRCRGGPRSCCVGDTRLSKYQLGEVSEDERSAVEVGVQTMSTQFDEVHMFTIPEECACGNMQNGYYIWVCANSTK